MVTLWHRQLCFIHVFSFCGWKKAMAAPLVVLAGGQIQR
jgi:hypothetical protein